VKRPVTSGQSKWAPVGIHPHQAVVHGVGRDRWPDADEQRIRIVAAPDQELRNLTWRGGEGVREQPIEIRMWRTGSGFGRLRLACRRSSISW